MSTDPDRINEEYRRTVAEHAAEREARLARRRAIERTIGLVVTICAATGNLVLCTIAIYQSIQLVTTAAQEHSSTSPVGLAISFMIVQVCAWVYIGFYPLYIKSLLSKKQ
ncbi:MAG TPA: hypothetical protein VIQ80_02955 [Candidatus Saccharimonadales bacterium]